jgi:hypothetical protein
MINILAFLFTHKTAVIGVIAATALAFYMLPLDDMITNAFAAKGDNNSGKNDNPERFKVCEHNGTPQKCGNYAVTK